MAESAMFSREDELAQAAAQASAEASMLGMIAISNLLKT